jgi:DNA-binding beta-propeller fold protein YncE
MLRLTIAIMSLASGGYIAAVANAEPAASPPSYNVVRSYQAGDAFWDYGVFDSAAQRVYFGRENGVTTIDVRTGTVNEQFVAGQQVHAIVLLRNNRVLATNGAAENAMIFERSTGKVVARIPTGKKPDGAGIEPVSGHIVIMDGISQDVVFADQDTYKVLGTLQLDGEPGAPVPDGKGHVFSGITNHSKIVMIDVASRKIVNTIALPDCDDSGGLALDAASGVLLATCANLKAIMVDSGSGRILGSVPIDKYPDFILFDAVRKVFYVPTIQPGNLFVIARHEQGGPYIKAKVPLGSGVHTEVLDAEGGVLYVPAGEIRFPKVHGQRPAVEPGTFRILAVNVSG